MVFKDLEGFPPFTTTLGCILYLKNTNMYLENINNNMIREAIKISAKTMDLKG